MKNLIIVILLVALGTFIYFLADGYILQSKKVDFQRELIDDLERQSLSLIESYMLRQKEIEKLNRELKVSRDSIRSIHKTYLRDRIRYSELLKKTYNEIDELNISDSMRISLYEDILARASTFK